MVWKSVNRSAWKTFSTTHNLCCNKNTQIKNPVKHFVCFFQSHRKLNQWLNSALKRTSGTKNGFLSEFQGCFSCYEPHLERVAWNLVFKKRKQTLASFVSTQCSSSEINLEWFDVVSTLFGFWWNRMTCGKRVPQLNLFFGSDHYFLSKM